MHKYIAIAITILSISLAGCGDKAGAAAGSISGTYANSEGSQFAFTGSRVKAVKSKTGAETDFTVEGNTLKFTFPNSGVPIEAKINGNSFTTTYGDTYKKVD